MSLVLLMVFPGKRSFPATVAYSRNNLDYDTVNVKTELKLALHKRGGRNNHTVKKYLNYFKLHFFT